eukprot:6421797-Pyramimonas_sp.AAC.1
MESPRRSWKWAAAESFAQPLSVIHFVWPTRSCARPTVGSRLRPPGASGSPTRGSLGAADPPARASEHPAGGRHRRHRQWHAR